MDDRVLFPHQVTGAAFLQEPGVKGLFYGMGTGKSLTALEAVKRLGLSQLIIVAPPIALTMWARETIEHLGLRDHLDNTHLCEGTVQILRTRKTPIGTANAVVLIMSYEIATTRAQELITWADEYETVLVCDESHALKSVEAKRTKEILGQRGLWRACTHTWLLTGTPSTKWNDDFFPFLLAADPKGMRKRLGGLTVERFRLRYCIEQKRKFSKSPYAKKVRLTVGNRNTKELAHWVYDGHAIRVDLEEVFEDMPPLTTTVYEVELDGEPATKAALETLKGMTLAEIQAGIKRKEPALATVRHDLGVAKVKAAADEILERLDRGVSVLVGAWHTDVIDALFVALDGPELDVDFIDGRVGAATRERIENAWNAGEIDVLIGQIGAMGVSLNLQQGGHNVVVVEEDWSPSVMDQFYARLWRFGQEKHVHVDILRDDTKLSKALARIASTKKRQHELINTIGREAGNQETTNG